MDKKNLPNNFSINQKDKIRTHEKLIESKLKQQLAKFGIVMQFDRIAHHGLERVFSN